MRPLAGYRAWIADLEKILVRLKAGDQSAEMSAVDRYRCGSGVCIVAVEDDCPIIYSITMSAVASTESEVYRLTNDATNLTARP